MPATMTRARRPLRRPAPNDFADALRAVKGASAMLRRACKREDAAIELMRYCRSVKPDASRDEI
ncbi:MAG: hypothetical protein JNK93_16335, partial [Planctomycetia bacterium]|nr:hypothetical protein [Planctomycetia bacterium]